MKRNYFEPEMNISTFSSEDVVTASGEPKIAGTSSDSSAFNDASEDNRATVSYNSFGFTF